MKNLKKILALALVMAMAMSTLAFAGLSDVKSTDSYASAINLCASLGIVGGFDDGTFQADGNVTREQFAKFAYVLMNGKDDGAALYKGVAPFGDVDSDRWSAGYIQWAKSRNIVAGRDVEQTVFDPSANVTFAEAAKMYVIALGYDAKNFTFPYGFIDKAQSLGLFADVKDYAVNVPANRGQVAQMTYNGLYADAPYFGSYQAAVGTGSSATTTELWTPLKKAFEIDEYTAKTVILNSTSSNAMFTSYVKDNQVNLRIDGGFTASFDYVGDVNDLIGSSVRVFYKDIKGTATGFDSGDLIVDIQEGKSNKQYSFKPADVKTSGSTTTSTTKLFVAIDGTTREFAWDLQTLTGGTPTVTSLGTVINGTGTHAPALFSDSTGNSFKAIDRDGNNTIDYVIVTETATAKVIGLDTTRLTLSNMAPAGSPVGYVGAKDLKDTNATIITLADGVAKDTWVNVSAKKTFTANNKTETIYSVAPTSELKGVVLGKVEGTGAAGTKYFFDGTARTIAKSTVGSVLFNTGTDVGTNYDLVLNANSYIVRAEAVSATAAGNWLYIKGTQNYMNGIDSMTSAVDVLLSDGTSKTIRVASDLKVGYGTATSTSTATTGQRDLSGKKQQAFTYTLNSAGEIVELCDMTYIKTNITGYKNGGAVQAQVPASTATYNKDTNVFGGGVVGYANSGTTVFFDGTVGGVSKYAAINGLELNSFTTTYSVEAGLRKDDTSYAVVVLKSTSSNTAPTKTSDKIGLVLNAVKEIKDGKYIYTFKVAFDGKVEEVKSTARSTTESTWDSSLLVGNTTYGYYTLKLNNAGEVTDLVRAAEGTGNNVRTTVMLDRVLSGALIGYDIGAQTYTYTRDDSVKYHLNNDGTGFTGTLGENVNYYLVNSTPVKGGTGATAQIASADGGFVAKTASVTVADKSILQESSTDVGGLAYVADVVTNNEGKVVSVYFYAQPILRAGGGTVTPPPTANSMMVAGAGTAVEVPGAAVKTYNVATKVGTGAIMNLGDYSGKIITINNMGTTTAATALTYAPLIGSATTPVTTASLSAGPTGFDIYVDGVKTVTLIITMETTAISLPGTVFIKNGATTATVAFPEKIYMADANGIVMEVPATLDAATITKLFTVANGTVTAATYDSATKKVKFTLSGVNGSGAVITAKADILDNAGNVSGTTALVTLDNTVPTVSVTTNTAAAPVITFAEANGGLYKMVNGELVALTDAEDVKALFAKAGVDTFVITSANYAASGKTITFALTGQVTDNVLVLAADKLFDSAGNAVAATKFALNSTWSVDTTDPTSSVTAAGNATGFTVTLTETLFKSGTKVADGVITGDFTIAGTGTITSATYSATAKTIVFVTVNGTNADVITMADVYTDASGNKYVVADRTFTCSSSPDWS